MSRVEFHPADPVPCLESHPHLPPAGSLVLGLYAAADILGLPHPMTTGSFAAGCAMQVQTPEWAADASVQVREAGAGSASVEAPTAAVWDIQEVEAQAASVAVQEAAAQEAVAGVVQEAAAQEEAVAGAVQEAAAQEAVAGIVQEAAAQEEAVAVAV